MRWLYKYSQKTQKIKNARKNARRWGKGAKLLSSPIEPVPVWSKGLWSCGHAKHSMQVSPLGKSRQCLMVIIILNDDDCIDDDYDCIPTDIQNLVCIERMFLPSRRQRKWVAKRRWKRRQCQCRCRRCERRGRGWSHQRRRKGSPWGRSPAAVYSGWMRQRKMPSTDGCRTLVLLK